MVSNHNNGVRWGSKFQVLLLAFLVVGLFSLGRVARCVTWSPGGAQQFAGPNGRGTRIRSDGNGNWVAVYWYDDPYLCVFKSTDNGSTWAFKTQIFPVNGGINWRYTCQPFDLETDENGTWVLVWFEFDYPTSDHELFCSISSDNGDTWTPARPINRGQRYLDSNQYEPHIAWNPDPSDPKGVWKIACVACENLNLENQIEIYTSTNSSGGWDWVRTNIIPGPRQSGYYFCDIESSRNANRDWVIAARYLRETNPGIPPGFCWYGGDWPTEIHFFAFSGNASPPSVPFPGSGRAFLSTNTFEKDPTASCQPKLATDRNGNWVATWADAAFDHDQNNRCVGVAGDIFVSISSSRGLTWSYPHRIHAYDSSDVSYAPNNNFPDIATDCLGHWLIVFDSDYFDAQGNLHSGVVRYAESDSVAGDAYGSFGMLYEGAQFNSYIGVAAGQGYWNASWTVYRQPPFVIQGTNSGVPTPTATPSPTGTPAPPSNDEWTNPIGINCGYSALAAITNGATPSTTPSGEPCGYSTIPDVWYSYISPMGYPDPFQDYGTGPRLTISFADDPSYGGGNPLGFIALYENDGPGNIRLVDWSCNRLNGAFSLSVPCGNLWTYYIRVGSESLSPNKTLTMDCFSKLP